MPALPPLPPSAPAEGDSARRSSVRARLAAVGCPDVWGLHSCVLLCCCCCSCWYDTRLECAAWGAAAALLLQGRGLATSECAPLLVLLVLFRLVLLLLLLRCPKGCEHKAVEAMLGPARSNHL